VFAFFHQGRGFEAVAAGLLWLARQFQQQGPLIAGLRVLREGLHYRIAVLEQGRQPIKVDVA